MSLALVACQKAPMASAGASSAPPLTLLRIAMVQPGTKCAADSPDWPAPERAYVRHLSERMEIPVTVCPVASQADAARAVADKRAEFALLDPASYAPYKAALRPILTQRAPMDLGRTEVVLAVGNGANARQLPDADRATLVFAGKSRPQLDGPRSTLASAGLPAATLAGARVLESPVEVSDLLHTSPGSVGAFLSADWSRLCRGMGKDDHPCTGLREIWRGRPQAVQAWVVRRDISLESWVRLVGIHVALFEDKPDVAHWLAPLTTEIEPTEATALDPIRTGK
jgi:hypothetical protein